MRSIDLIVIHCSATRNGVALGDKTRTAMQVIDGWHKQRGFKRAYGARVKLNPNLEAIGYHCVIDTGGYIGAGRDLAEIGAHAKGHNATSIGICCVGTDAYTLPQWASLASLVASLSRKFPEARVVGHRDLSPDLDGDGTVEPQEWTKTCPGFDVATWLEGGMAPLADHLLESA